MSNSLVDTAETHSRLIQDFYSLPPLEQKIIQLFSVIYEPVKRTAFVDCLNYIGARDSKHQPFNSSKLKPYIEKLLAAGLLIQGQGKGPQCHPLLAEVATRSAVKSECFAAMAEAVEEKLPIRTYFTSKGKVFQNRTQLLREVRLGIYNQDIEFIYEQLEDYEKYGYHEDNISATEIFDLVCNNPFDADWFRTLSLPLYRIILPSILINSILKLSPATEAFAVLESGCAQPGEYCADFLQMVLAEQLLFRGCLQETQECLERISADFQNHAAVFWGWFYFLKGDNDKAINYYTIALKHFKKAKNKKKAYFNTIGGLFFILALLKDGSPNRLKEAEEYCSLIERQSDHWLRSTYTQLKILLRVQQGDIAQKELILSNDIPILEQEHSLETFFSALCFYWVDAPEAKAYLPLILEPVLIQAIASEYHWLAMETAELLSRLKPNSSYGTQAEILREDIGVESIVNVVRFQESWELCLNALVNIHKPPQETQKVILERRLVWFLTSYSSGCVLQPREQKINAKGVWSKGRVIALRRLQENLGEFDYLTTQDIRVCGCIETFTTYNYGYRGRTEYTFNEKAISVLIGHPLVFWEDSPNTRVEIVKGEPELIVKKGKAGRLILKFLPHFDEKSDVVTVKETPTRVKVIEINSEHRRIADILGKKNRLEVPETAQEQVLAAINTVSTMVTVHSDIGGGLENVEEVPVETTPHIHLLPAGEGLKIAILSRPFADGGSYYRPGKGGATVIAEIDGKRLQTTRNLKQEKQLKKEIIAICPTLTSYEPQDGEWFIEEVEDCLELLLELQELGDRVILEWPEGEKFRVSHNADFSNFELQIKRQRDWFAVDGNLNLDENLVLDMQHLLQLLEGSPSRFVRLGDGQFLALTIEFRQRLDELQAFTQRNGKGMGFHPTSILAMEDLVDGVGKLKADKHWKTHIQHLQEMKNLQPELPSTLQAQLRDYQLEGFNWLSRLAYWGVGACLADQMGLGKTLQALAVILQRAPQGATLIIAPTSVCMNWMSEAEKFAPTLNLIQFGSGNRQKLLDELQPFDMLVCSYGLLQQEEVAQMLSEVEWQTIVLDEAQAIKNIATKRSQAAMNLRSPFKLITTGTPVENHLGELWNLFRFINPGLLGSRESFNQRFAVPIEKFQDKQARQRLKKLIQPFLLRRTKTQVLSELPSRTEIKLHVELSQEEMAMYEAFRQQAITKLADSDATAGHKHLQVLAEIMKLRRACCHSKLVMPDAPLPSSKLQLFGEVLAELLENRHKALVFSQFVDHLEIIRNYLDEQSINYQYLDGSTSTKERKKRVDAFQAGEGDVFLISLKAGGTGLNLTAADYVIHMDPWWNPAVEDQASDRAHRIGQQRPVTIYRLVTKDTIEDKIVDLHRHKRDLADSLLEGADMSGKISTDELLQLIQRPLSHSPL